MRRLGKTAALVVIISGALAALSFGVYQPYRCSLALRQARTRTEKLIRSGDRPGARVVSRGIMDRLSVCRRCCAAEIDAYMIRAANLRLLGRYSEAVLEYRRALEYQRRPEIYMNLGEVLVQTGAREEGLEMVRRALEFNPHLLQSITQPDIKEAVAAHGKGAGANSRH